MSLTVIFVIYAALGLFFAGLFFEFSGDDIPFAALCGLLWPIIFLIAAVSFICYFIIGLGVKVSHAIQRMVDSLSEWLGDLNDR